MSKRSNVQVSLKLDASPKSPQTAGGNKKDRINCSLLRRIIPFTRSNLLAFLVGFVSSSFLYMSLIDTSSNPSQIDIETGTTTSTSKLAAIVVPFRDRFDELEQFVPHLSRYLAHKSITNHIWIVNQGGGMRFNRAALINVGFLMSAKSSDYMIMHDVDLLPMNEDLDYSYPPPTGPVHISAPGIHPQYDYASFSGGIMSIRHEHFLATNGMSNRYWGWGKEDDEFALRLKDANLTVSRPGRRDLPTGKRFTFREVHDTDRRIRDKKRFAKQKNEALRRDDTGLSNIQYRIDAVRNVTFSGKFTCTIVDVVLFCNRADTHWCTMDYQFYD